MEKRTHIKDLLDYELQSLYWLEKHMQEALPKLIKKANHSSLKNFMKHYASLLEDKTVQLPEMTETITKHKQAQELCKAAEALIGELTYSFRDINADGAATDLLIITGLQKIESYKSCCYNNAILYTSILGLRKQEKLLQKKLQQEREERDLLNRLMKALLPKRETEFQKEENYMNNQFSPAGLRNDEETDEVASQSIDSTQNIQSPGGRAGTSHRSYSHGESRGH